MTNEAEKNLEQDIQQWKGHERKFSGIFSAEVLASTEFKKERLRQLMIIAARYRGYDSGDSAMLRVLSIERKLLEKQLYPRLLTRLFQRFVALFRMKRLNGAIDRKLKAGAEHILLDLQKSGFSRYADQARSQLLKGEQSFSLGHSEPAGKDAVIEYTLNFSLKQGQAVYDGYKAVYTDQQRGLHRQHFFKREETGTISADTAKALLSGMAVKGADGEWLQMDFNDKDTSGNFRLLRFADAKTDAAIMQQLHALPFAAKPDERSLDILFNDMAMGKHTETVLVLAGKETTVTIGANPRHAGLLLLNGNGKPVIIKSEPAPAVMLQKQQTETKSKTKMQVLR